MTNHAERQKRRRRRIVAAILALALGVAIVMGGLWRRSVAETRRAEAQKLLALGQVELETWPSVALAYAISSLELADSAGARLFALRALAEGMPATVLRLDEEHERAHKVVFNPDGTWAALQGFERLQVISRDGSTHRSLESFHSDGAAVQAAFDARGQRLFGAKSGVLRAWSVPEFQVIEEQALPEGVTRRLVATPRGVFTLTEQGEEAVVTRHQLGEEQQVLGRITTQRGRADIDSSGQWLAFSAGNQLLLRSLEDWTRPERLIGSHDGEIQVVVFHPAGDRLATRVAGKFRIWSIYAEVSEPIHEQASTLWGLAFDPTDRILAMWGQDTEGSLVELRDLRASLDALPSRVSVALPELGEMFLNGATVDPHGEWLATGNVNVVGFWPLNGNAPRILSREGRQLDDLEFTPDGAHLVSSHRGGILRLWGLGVGSSGRELPHSMGAFLQLDVDPAGRRIAVARQGGALVVPLNGDRPRELDGFSPSAWVVPAAFDAEGRLVAAASVRGPRSEKVIWIWDLETDESWTLGPTEEAGDGFDGQVYDLGFRPDGSLVSVGHGGLRIWSPRERSYEFIAPTPQQTKMTLFDEGRFAAYSHDSGALAITDLETKTTRTLPEHEVAVSIAVDSHNDILVTGGGDGIVRVGPIDGERTHLLIGHAQMVRAVAISPDGKWIASGSDEGTIRLWPMPDLSQTPLHELPHDELVAKLHSLTNVRVAPDDESGTGWRVEIGPFPGWEEVPTW
jgi:WD40 repeat protein